MGTDKARDDKYFNCSEEHEFDYVSGQYADKQMVYDFLKEQCDTGKIKYSTHDEVYQLIKEDLGLSR